ncbi:TraB/GumN family protein [Pararhizobium sp. BT-229]|uniref:TraB/GumN family protein n=1 Tax=Pararhizobium sp. BT-229 TaxID=2986923 RepID=UPI0021F6D3C6|nr:TraB/GumN family protein [Pararhizobium sp. BT-229]MCV9966057.1 TraB/GumN family protein [Pararhizobium sp. BT-229]
MHRISFFHVILSSETVRTTLARFLGAILLFQLAFILPANAEEPPVCTGKNLLAEMERSDPQALAVLRKQAAETPNGQGIFWKIERAGTEPSYLLGTMHITDPRVVITPEEAWAPFDNADTVALELESGEPMDIARALFSRPELTMFTDGTSMKTLLTAEELDRLEALLKQRGIPLFAVAKMKPWMLLMHISLPACEKKRAAAGLAPLDLSLMRIARDLDKTVVGLETAAEQMESLSAIDSAPLLRTVLQQMEAGDKLDDMFATMTDMYLAGDTGMFVPLSYHILGTTAGSDPGFDDFMKIAVVDRNIRMAERAAHLLEDGNAFIAVGALHLIGEQGLVELFRKQGYTVTRLH